MKRALGVGICLFTVIAAHASQPAPQQGKEAAMKNVANHTKSESPEPASELPILGSLLGLWDVSMTSRNRDGSWPEESKPFLWRWYSILDGQAIQDDWIRLTQKDDVTSQPTSRVMGTNIRIYNPEEELWHMAWIDSTNRKVATFTATNHDGTVVMRGDSAQGRPIRITFSNFTSQTFEWTQEWTSDGGETWFPVAKMQCRRRE